MVKSAADDFGSLLNDSLFICCEQAFFFHFHYLLYCNSLITGDIGLQDVNVRASSDLFSYSPFSCRLVPNETNDDVV